MNITVGRYLKKKENKIFDIFNSDEKNVILRWS